MSIFIEYSDHDQLMMGIAQVVAKQLGDVVAQKGRATLAVPGGTTPAPFLERLSLMDLQWDKISVLVTDERVQPSDPFRSNFKMVEHYLRQNASEKAQLLPLADLTQTADEALESAAQTYAPLLPLDVLVLGMGGDMHTASLFPDSPELDAALAPDAPSFMVMNSPSQPEKRITMTAPVLQNARYAHLLIAGADKLAAYRVAEAEGSVKDAPVRCILHSDNTALVHYTGAKT